MGNCSVSKRCLNHRTVQFLLGMRWPIGGTFVHAAADAAGVRVTHFVRRSYSETWMWTVRTKSVRQW